MKQFIVRISYTEYAISPEDAVALLAIASRAQSVKQIGYSGPYYVQPTQEVWLDQITMAEVLNESESEVVDKFSAATRDVVPL